MNSAPLLQMACTLRNRKFDLHADFTSTAPITGIFGPPGSGKTSLLHAIAGLIRPADGFIKVAGTPMVNVKGRWWLPPHQRRIGVLFQDNRLFPHLDVRDNLLFGYRRIPRAVRRILPEEIIGLLRLEPLLNRRTPSLSTDEARRVALGQTLLTSPRLLLLDEPLTGLEPLQRRDLLAFLITLPRRLEIPLVYASHTRADVVALVQHALAIRDGEVVEVNAQSLLLDDSETYLTGTVESSDPSGHVRVRIGENTLVAVGPEQSPGTRVRVALSGLEVLPVSTTTLNPS